MSATPNDMKLAAAARAAQYLEDGMIVGLGSGSTASLAVAEIGRRVSQGLRITGIPTSEKTAAQARSLGISLATLAEYPDVDLTIDGADEVESPTLDLIKGGGGNLLREKIVASASKQLVIVVDRNKLVERLGASWAIPVEVAQFGWQSTARRLAALGSEPVLRLNGAGSMLITDGGNCILDCRFKTIESTASLQACLDATVGVVEHGLFIGMTSRVVVGDPDGVRIQVAHSV